ncbi:MAG: archease, partial [Patescibacteria group bacterium]
GPPSLVEEISLRATDQTTLLIDFLSEIVGRAYTQKAVFTRVVFAELNPTNLKAKISGVKVRQFDEDIKAVTYHEANIVKNNQGAYETTVVLDI